MIRLGKEGQVLVQCGEQRREVNLHFTLLFPRFPFVKEHLS